MLRDKHENIAEVYAILASLKGISCVKFSAMKAIVNSKQKAKTSVRKHVLKLINLLNEIRVNDSVLYTFNQVDMILKPLSPSFTPLYPIIL